jgi:hypothetical protein
MRESVGTTPGGSGDGLRNGRKLVQLGPTSGPAMVIGGRGGRPVTNVSAAHLHVSACFRNAQPFEPQLL